MFKYFTKIVYIYNRHIRGHQEEPRFLILSSFTLTFIVARFIVYNIKYHIFSFIPNKNVVIHEIHIHHLVFGIILLLIAGFIRIPQFGRSLFRLSSILYGMGAALTLDEFALWLRFNPDVYWGPQGRISIDAVVLFILIMLSTLWHGVFWRKLFHYTIRYFFRKSKISLLLYGKIIA